ncbi:MAG TPA: hypothetical protein VGJ20_14960 [Xanthobacteraceae bacterium]
MSCLPVSGTRPILGVSLEGGHTPSSPGDLPGGFARFGRNEVGYEIVKAMKAAGIQR